MHLCTCNNCGGIFYDTNTQPSGQDKSIRYVWRNERISRIFVEPLQDHKCPTCDMDDYLVDNINHPALNELTKEMAEMVTPLPQAIQEAIKRKVPPNSIAGAEIYPQLDIITEHLVKKYPYEFICVDFDKFIYTLLLKWYDQPQK